MLASRDGSHIGVSTSHKAVCVLRQKLHAVQQSTRCLQLQRRLRLTFEDLHEASSQRAVCLSGAGSLACAEENHGGQHQQLEQHRETSERQCWGGLSS